jgi:glycogen synthase
MPLLNADSRNTAEKKFDYLPNNFNKKKINQVYKKENDLLLNQMLNVAKEQCLGSNNWVFNGQINGWMITAETATFLKCGGLGMVGSELPENFNNIFAADKHEIKIVTPLYIGDTGKKKASFEDDIYTGSEGRAVKLKKIMSLDVPFIGTQNKLQNFAVEIYGGTLNGVRYIFLHNERFFTISPDPTNPSTQDGCYVYNKNKINEVERFAFFSKAIYCLLENIARNGNKQISVPTLLIANDWHSGALAGLTKYLTYAKVYANRLTKDIADKIRNIPIVHIVHHMGYQGWDYKNTAKILNSLYEDMASLVFSHAKAVKNANPRTSNTLIVGDCFNMASANLHLADRIVTVSKNYLEEISKELSLGLDFRDILKLRKNAGTFFGIVNGYEKKLISPNAKKIEEINKFFRNTQFKVYDSRSLDIKQHNKKECIKLLSRLAGDDAYKDEVIPLIETYKFDNILYLLNKAENIPFICMTSRMVEQKGYDIAINAILKMIDKYKNSPNDFPIFVLGGAGNKDLYSDLMTLKDNAKQIYPEFAKHIFVYRGYKDQFAYAIQLAADFYLMPSYFEPCGLTQMEAMAKGCLPIATSTGGLVDTIEDCVDGFRTDVFFTNGSRVFGANLKAQQLKNNINAYTETLEKALRCFYTTPKTLRIMQQNAMQNDFSWSVPNGSVYQYYKLFKTGTL